MSYPDELLLATRVALINDSRAFEQLVAKHQSAIRRFMLHQTLGDAELSDDLAQETFIKAYLHIGSYKGTARFSTWLFRIAYHVFIDYCKKNLRQRQLLEGYSSDEAEGVSHTEQINTMIDIAQALKYLREEERTAIDLFYIEDLSHKRIAMIMDCPEGTVKSYILRGLHKLEKHLKIAGYDNTQG